MKNAVYTSPIGELLVAWDAVGLTGLWFMGQKHFPREEFTPAPIHPQAKAWLDAYFAGNDPGFCPPLHLRGTPFQLRVWALLMQIPYGQTATYGALAKALGSPGAAQAVGAAVGRNPVSLIVPCHRVLGKEARLTGYAAGVEKKQYLLRLETRP